MPKQLCMGMFLTLKSLIIPTSTKTSIKYFFNLRVFLPKTLIFQLRLAVDKQIL